MTEQEQEENGQEVSLRVKKTEDGEILPIDGTSPQLGIDVKVKPITVAQSQKIDNWGAPVLDFSLEEKAMLLRDNVVEPDDFGEDLTVEELATEFEAYAVDDILQAVVMYSGYKRFFERHDDIDQDEVGKEIT